MKIMINKMKKMMNIIYKIVSKCDFNFNKKYLFSMYMLYIYKYICKLDLNFLKINHYIFKISF